MTLTFKIAPHAHGHRPDFWQEMKVSLYRDDKPEAAFTMYRNRDCIYDPWGRWHLVNFGRTFDTPEEAGQYLVDTWDREPTADEIWEEELAARTYQAQIAYACGER